MRREYTYTYDAPNRLTQAEYSDGKSYEYRYDARRPEQSHGNRKVLTTTEGTITTTTVYTYDAANRLTAVNDVSYTWDNRGNLTHDGTFTHTYNAGRWLVKAKSVTTTVPWFDIAFTLGHNTLGWLQPEWRES